MAVREDRWLSERVGHPVYTVEPDAPVDELRAHVGERGRRTYQTRVPTDRVETVRTLTALGFYVVDTSLTLERPPERLDVDGEVVLQRPEQRERVVEIARSSFRFSRFHLDPGLPAGVADRIKADWIESYFTGARGDHLLVGLVDGEAAGFLAVLAMEDGGRALRVIDLVAVAAEARGRGLARALTAAFLDESVGVCDAVRVGTQAANVPATRLYESMGFTLARTEYALHLHTEAAG